MKIELEIPDYDGVGTDVIWEDGADYSLAVCEDSVVLRANRSGMLSFAKQLLYFACSDLPQGAHVHYDEFFTGHVHDYELILEEMDTGSGNEKDRKTDK